MSVQTDLEARTALLRAILNGSNAALAAKDGTGALTLSGLPAAIQALPDAETKLQDKTITENGTYRADSDYDGLGIVTVEVEGGGSAIPEPYATYIAEAEEVYTGEYANVIYAEGYGEQTGVTYKTVMFLLGNWAITAYDAATTAYTHSGFMMVQKEDDGAWVLTDYSNTSTDTHYAKNIKAASCYIEYNGMTLFPVGINNYPDTVAIDYSNFANGSFTETLETGDTLDYAVGFDADGRPNKITAPDGTVTWIDWGES